MRSGSMLGEHGDVSDFVSTLCDVLLFDLTQ